MTHCPMRDHALHHGDIAGATIRTFHNATQLAGQFDMLSPADFARLCDLVLSQP